MHNNPSFMESSGPDTPAVEVTSPTSQRNLRTDLMNSGMTKTSGSSVNMGSDFESMKILSTQGSSTISLAPNQKTALAFDKGNLTTILEEVKIEDGCENELESGRQTIQGLR